MTRATRLPNASLSDSAVYGLCQTLGAKLAKKGFRVTSGYGPGVGVPAVSAAFSEDPLRARFYLRKAGKSVYNRTAPAIVVPSHDESFGAMRQRFVLELSLLVALGGVNYQAGIRSGAIEEIELALKHQIPTILIPQAGGHVYEYQQQFLGRIGAAYPDPLAAFIRAANEKVWALSAPELEGSSAGDRMVSLFEDVIYKAVGAAIRDRSVGRKEW
jgi:hypothetical protein